MALNALGLSKSYAQLARVHPAVVTAVAKPLTLQLQRGFESGTNPYGAPFAQLTAGSIRRGRTPPPLTETGALKASAVLIPTPSGLIRHLGPYYGFYHMAGTKWMVKRRYFPDAGLPSAWLDIIDHEYKRILKVSFR